MSLSNSSRRYCSYLLRLWLEPSGSAQRPDVWRFMLQDSQTGERHGFVTMENLVQHLYAQMDAPAKSDAPVISQTDAAPTDNVTPDDAVRHAQDGGPES